jgi:hypothetical protein
MWAVELSPDTLLVKGVQLTAVDGIADDGTFARLVMVIVEGFRNDNPTGDLVSVPLLLRTAAINRLIAGLTNVAEPVDPSAHREAFTGWLLACRAGMNHEPAKETRQTVDNALSEAGDELGFNVSDRATIEAMLFGIAASQAVHIALTDKTPDDEGFGDTMVGAFGLLIDALTRRLPGLT